MQTLRLLLGASSLLMVAGCAGGAGTPATPSPSGAADATLPTPTYGLYDGGESLVGMYTVVVDPGSLAAQVSHVPGRQAAAQGQLVDIDIDQFLWADSFGVDGVSFDVDGDVVLDFHFEHPFQRPDVSAPSNPGTNRADLSATGRLLILSDHSTNSYFSGVTVDPSLVKDADGYCDPGTLLVSGTVTNDLHPYVLLADEALDSRMASGTGTPISTGGAGDYSAAAGGWQRSNMGAGDGWTGFDFIHAGQTVTNSFTLRASELAAADYSVDVALLVKYNNPKRTGGPATPFRLPPATVSVLDFAYRLPFAALDASVSTFGGVSVDTAASSVSDPVAGLLRDWDAAAGESADSDLTDESDVSLVQPGASGAPVADVSAPFLAAGTTSLTAGTESGVLGDELTYGGTLTNSLGTAAEGDYYALVRFTDPEAGLSDDTYHFGVDGTTLLPDPARALSAITYQVLPVSVEVSCTAPVVTGVTPASPTSAGCGGTMATFNVQLDPLSCPATAWSWNFGSGATPATSALESPMVTLSGTPNTYPGTVQVTNALGSSAVFNFNFVVSVPWGVHLAGTQPAGFGSGAHGGTAIYDGRPVITHTGYNLNWPSVPSGTTGKVYLTMGNIAEPAVAADWTTIEVFSGPMASGTLTDYYSGVAVSNNRLFVLYKDDLTNNVVCARATSAAPFAPTGPGSFTTHVVDPSPNDEGQMWGAVTINDRIAVAYQDVTLTDLKLAYAKNNDPMSTADWDSMMVDGSAPASASTSGYFAAIGKFDNGTGEKPVICSAWLAGGLLQPRLAVCNVAVPTFPLNIGQWTYITLDTTAGGNPGRFPRLTQATIGGQPRMVVTAGDFNRRIPMVYIATTLNPAIEADFRKVDVVPLAQASPASGFGNDVSFVNGRLVVSWDYYSAGGLGKLGIARATVEDPMTSADFTFSYPDSSTTAGIYPKNVVTAGGTLLVTYRDPHYSDVIGTGLWAARSNCP